MTQFLIGLGLGAPAGFSPGPLTILVISETLHKNRRAGMLVACAPLITDFPIIIGAMWVLRHISGLPLIMAVLSILGGLYISYLAWKNFKTAAISETAIESQTSSLWKGVITNFFNPNPYMFWMTVGVSLINNALQQGAGGLILFLAGFYGGVVGVKMGIAVVVGYSHAVLRSRGYFIVNRIMSVLLFGIAVFLFYQAGKYFIEMVG